jgi:peptidoglycan L-alanyl-D-glutamate endopeptidase CwlK
MPNFGKASLTKLDTCHPDIKRVMLEVIKELDITIVFGHRTPSEQLALYKQGRVFSNGRWVKTGKTVTDKDGTVKKSKHNHLPSLAIDICPYPVDWNNLDRFYKQKDVVMKCAKRLGVELVWGADWDGDGDIAEHTLQDYPHFELKA